MDCVGVMCCGPCIICQDANEVMHAGGYNVPYCSAAEAAAMSSKVAPA